MTQIKLHWTYKVKIKKLYKDGFTTEELALMYKVNHYVISSITRLIERPERI